MFWDVFEDAAKLCLYKVGRDSKSCEIGHIV